MLLHWIKSTDRFYFYFKSLGIKHVFNENQNWNFELSGSSELVFMEQCIHFLSHLVIC